MKIFKLVPVIAVLIGFAGVSSAQIADLTDLRVRHQAAINDITQLAVDWQTRHVLPGGALNPAMKFVKDTSIGQPQYAEQENFPSNDEEYFTSGSLRIKQGKILFTMVSDGLNAQTGQLERAGSRETHYFDGETWKFLYERKNGHREGHQSLTGDRTSGFQRLYQIEPVGDIFRAYRRLFIDESNKYEALSSAEGIRLVETPNESGPFVYTSFDFQQGSPFALPTHITRYLGPDIPATEVSFNYDPGQPRNLRSMNILAHMQGFNRDMRADILKFEINGDIPDSVFSLEFPVGTLMDFGTQYQTVITSQEHANTWTAETLLRMRK